MFTSTKDILTRKRTRGEELDLDELRELAEHALDGCDTARRKLHKYWLRLPRLPGYDALRSFVFYHAHSHEQAEEPSSDPEADIGEMTKILGDASFQCERETFKTIYLTARQLLSVSPDLELLERIAAAANEWLGILKMVREAPSAGKLFMPTV